MSITQCPKCDEKVTVPAGGHRDARVRCPLCQAEYLLAEALNKLPPALILLDVPLNAPIEMGELSIESETSSDELNLEPAETAREFAFESAPAGTATLTKPATIRPSARPKRKPKSPVVEGLKIVVGGALGLVIAQLILFWIPIARLGKQQRDPADLAPKIARFAPFLVPENLRGQNQSGGGDAKGDGKSVAKNGKPNNNGPAKTNGNANSGDKIEPIQLPIPDGTDDLLFPANSGSTKKTSDEPSLDIGLPDSPKSGTPDFDPFAPDKPKTKATSSVPKNSPPDDLDTPKPDEPKPAPQETAATPLVLRDAPSFSAADVTAALESFQAANEAWAQSDDQDRDAAKKLKSAFYQSPFY